MLKVKSSFFSCAFILQQIQGLHLNMWKSVKIRSIFCNKSLYFYTRTNQRRFILNVIDTNLDEWREYCTTATAVDETQIQREYWKFGHIQEVAKSIKVAYNEEEKSTRTWLRGVYLYHVTITRKLVHRKTGKAWKDRTMLRWSATPVRDLWIELTKKSEIWRNIWNTNNR